MNKIPIPTVVETTRTIKNDKVGIDIKSVNFWIEKEEKLAGFLDKTTIYYQLLVVTNRAKLLGCKKANSKMIDICDGKNYHFTIGKSYNEILLLRNELDSQFSGTFFPHFPKALRSSDARSEARSLCDVINKFLEVCCSTQKVAFSKLFLHFWGFQFSSDLLKDMKKSENLDIFEENERDEKLETKVKEEDLFIESRPDEDIIDEFSNFDISKTESSSNKNFGLFKDDKMFEEQEIKVEIESSDEDDDLEDISDLMSKLKALPVKIEKSQQHPIEVKNKDEKQEADVDVDVWNEKELSEYINQNLKLENISLDFD